ncbi:MAG: hypothetical protein CM1200mP34_4670 [Verrucomicrobiales bacterium]|nr:MAG: hypothetical protein CM1200mP34_4670 [Verrucomicrobiales bacterium]
MGPVEDLGLLKMDFLGLKTLTVIRNTCEMVKQWRDIEVDLDHVPTDDAKAYEQLNSGQRSACSSLNRAECATCAGSSSWGRSSNHGAVAYTGRDRWTDPGLHPPPHGEVEITTRIRLEPIANETYGILIYQEQVMKAAQVLAGYTWAPRICSARDGKKKVGDKGSSATFLCRAAPSKQHFQAKGKRNFDLLRFPGVRLQQSHGARLRRGGPTRPHT